MDIQTLIVVASLSLSLGLGGAPAATDCAEVVRLVSQHGKITHVTPLTGLADDRLALSPARLQAVRPVLAYTIQGPGHEVGIVACGAAAREDTDPVLATSLTR